MPIEGPLTTQHIRDWVASMRARLQQEDEARSALEASGFFSGGPDPQHTEDALHYITAGGSYVIQGEDLPDLRAAPGVTWTLPPSRSEPLYFWGRSVWDTLQGTQTGRATSTRREVKRMKKRRAPQVLPDGRKFTPAPEDIYREIMAYRGGNNAEQRRNRIQELTEMGYQLPLYLVFQVPDAAYDYFDDRLAGFEQAFALQRVNGENVLRDQLLRALTHYAVTPEHLRATADQPQRFRSLTQYLYWLGAVHFRNVPATMTAVIGLVPPHILQDDVRFFVSWMQGEAEKAGLAWPAWQVNDTTDYRGPRNCFEPCTTPEFTQAVEESCSEKDHLLLELEGLMTQNEYARKPSALRRSSWHLYLKNNEAWASCGLVPYIGLGELLSSASGHEGIKGVLKVAAQNVLPGVWIETRPLMEVEHIGWTWHSLSDIKSWLREKANQEEGGEDDDVRF